MRFCINPFQRSAQALRRDVFGRFPSRIWAITAIELLISAGFSICLPFLALYLYQERDLPMTLVGTTILIGGLCSAATQLVGGVLSDRFGRRRLLLGTTAICIIMYTGLAILIGIGAPVWTIITVYIAGRTVSMVARPAMAAMVADLSPKDRLTETYALLKVGGNAGFAAGPAVGGYLMTFLPYGWLFSMAVLSCALAFLLILFFLRESFYGASERVDFRSMLSVVSHRTFLLFTGLCLLVFLAMVQLGSTLSVFTVDRLGFSTAQYGLLLTINGLIIVAFQYPVVRAIGRLTKAQGLILGSLLFGIGYLSMSWVGSFSWAIIPIVVVTAGEIVFSPLTLTVVAELAPEERRGRYMGFFGLGQTLGMSFGPLLGGILLDSFPTDPLFIWGIIASVLFLAALGFHYWQRRASYSR